MGKRGMICLAAVIWLVGLAGRVTAAELAESATAEEIFARAVVLSYPEADFGEMVGMAAVVHNRMASAGFPDTCGQVLAHFGDGCFSSSSKPDEKVLRLTRDALDLALAGADVTSGALYFTVIDDGDPVYDLRFDNSGEKEKCRVVENCADRFTVIADGIGFSGEKNPAAPG